jgi:cystathionine beta-lyase
MKYDFDQMCDRTNTDCVKWDAIPAIFGRKDVIPMWVADMDFPVAPPIVEALKKRVEHEFYGYTLPGENVIDAIVDRMQRKFNWKIEPEWVVLTPGVIPALNIAVRSFTEAGALTGRLSALRLIFSTLYILKSRRPWQGLFFQAMYQPP